MLVSLNKREGVMEKDDLSLNFVISLFDGKDEKEIVKYVFEGLNEHDIIQRLIISGKEEVKRK